MEDQDNVPINTFFFFLNFIKTKTQIHFVAEDSPEHQIPLPLVSVHTTVLSLSRHWDGILGFSHARQTVCTQSYILSPLSAAFNRSAQSLYLAKQASDFSAPPDAGHTCTVSSPKLAHLTLQR